MILVVLFSSATQLFCLGILGEYIGRLFEEVKRRPVYLVKHRINIDAEPPNRASTGPQGDGNGGRPGPHGEHP